MFAALNLDELILELKDRSKLKAADATGTPREALLRLMIKNGADVNARNNEGATPLQISLRSKRTMTAQVLLESGADAGRHGTLKN